MRITILAENYSSKAPHSEEGFAALIETENKNVLFDTGISGDCVINNANHLGIDLKKIDAIVLSHGHDDHSGGLEKILQFIGPTKIYAHPNIFANRYSSKLEGPYYTGIPHSKNFYEKKLGAKFLLSENAQYISNQCSTSGEVPIVNNQENISAHFKVKNMDGHFSQDLFYDDNNLIVKSSLGILVICGCAHRGIVNILSHVKMHHSEPLVGFIGGTHLANCSKEHLNFVMEYLKNNPMPFMAPAHCTGKDRIDQLKKLFPIKDAHAGNQFTF